MSDEDRSQLDGLFGAFEPRNDAHELVRADLERQVAEATAALRTAQLSHEAAIAAADRQLATLKAEHDIALARASVTWEMVDEQLRSAAIEVERARRDRADATAEAERLTLRASELTSRLAEATEAEGELRSRLDDLEHALETTTADLHRERHAAAEESETRQREFDTRESALKSALAEITTSRDDLERQLAATQAAFDDASTRATRERLEASKRAAAREAELHGQIRHEVETRTALEQALAEKDAELRNAQQQHEAAATAASAEFEARLSREHATRVTIEEALAHTEAALRDSRSATLDAERAHHEEREALRTREVELKAGFDVQLAQQQLELESRLADIDESRRTLAREREALQQSLAAVQEHAQRSLEQSGFASFRCTREGVLIDANRACAALIGRSAIDELRDGSFASTVFESPDVLSWLIERCISAETRESVETTWRRHDGGRLFVRLAARLTPSDHVNVEVEDLTRIRVLEERIGQSQRMEAVGRFASEVALTCSNLLIDIHQKGCQWLATASDSVESRQQGQHFVDEVARAAGLVRQLAACGEEQSRTPMLSDLNSLVRDLEPVLKRVAGGDVDFQFRDATVALNVDAQIEQVERLLVNLASYGRQRGGQLRIEVGTTVVDRQFAERHPNLRVGVHALITVTEIKRSDGGTNQGVSYTDHAAAQRSAGKALAQMGFDLGTLQTLVTECGGHLWMRVQPLGDLVVKVRLPLLNAPEQLVARPVAARGGRERSGRWFQS